MYFDQLGNHFRIHSNQIQHIRNLSNNYNNLEEYAYSAYVNRFQDEKHWLIVYEELGDVSSLPEDMYRYPSSDEPEWQFWGMQGDDTDPILTAEVTEKFNAIFRQKLID